MFIIKYLYLQNTNYMSLLKILREILIYNVYY